MIEVESVDRRTMGLPPSIALRSLGHGLATLTEVGFGGAPVGNLYEAVSDDDARSAVASATAAGINYFDTAPFYGLGVSERRIGDALDGAGAVSSKVGRILVGEPDNPDAATTAIFDYGARGVVRSIESSLARLRRDRLDIVLIHDIGRETHGGDHARVMETIARETLPELRRLQAAGVVGAIGIGVNEVAVCLEALDRFELDVVMVSGRYSLLDQQAAETLFPVCLDRGIGVIVGGVFNSGMLASATAPGLTFNYTAPPFDVIDRARALYALAAEHDVDVGAAALQFTLAHPAIVSVIVGVRSAAEVHENVSRYWASIPRAFWAALRRSSLLGDDVPLPA